MNDSLINHWDIDLNYTGENEYSSFFSTNGSFHGYPAKAFPKMVSTIIQLLRSQYNIRSVLDPFVGSGTVGLEAKYSGLDFLGSDLNPLSILLARTKVLTVHNTYTIKEIEKFLDNELNDSVIAEDDIPNFNKIDYWFKEKNIQEISIIRKKVDKFLSTRTKKYREQFALILFTALSATIRKSSLSRNDEFKLYRMSPKKIKEHNIDSKKEFRENVEVILDMLQKINFPQQTEVNSEVYLSNAKDLSYMGNRKVDLILTSPPYGDSKSTVAYGQYSKLSLQWLGDLIKKYLNIPISTENCDEDLLGGKNSQTTSIGSQILKESETLSSLYDVMNKKVGHERKRYGEVLSYLNKLISNDKTQEKLSLISGFSNNSLLWELITERLRLTILRKLKEIGTLSDKKVKEIAKYQAYKKMDSLAIGDKRHFYKTYKMIMENIPKVKETIKRKISSYEKRKKEVMHFFEDLYAVVIKTNEVLNKDGIQAWIVGHRTVMGDITINFERILSEWFSNLGYVNVTSLSRDYSFKRLPHSINSTILRNEEIQTMLQEYILIVQKERG
ncbi:site-specific DNA-methyltransferase [Virgibacillus sp. MSP4-1]|uniref:DNA adenine methylase n=1 Tax=Virgibacillus sp. MSP4-1 TaxID=2700081 RepID=UPI00039C110E|nr:DNA adenine methylase [Virgibacillus sp. MSP4-1]QHS23462.1 site-specific DNA-methyltransferase [Virgibacillus sp. MSP4-1]